MSQTTEGTVSLLTVPHNERLTELRANQLPRDVWGSSSPLLGVATVLEPTRRRLSVSKGTRETRLSRVVTTLRIAQEITSSTLALVLLRGCGGA